MIFQKRRFDLYIDSNLSFNRYFVWNNSNNSFNLEVSIEFLNSVNADLNFKRNLKNCKIKKFIIIFCRNSVGDVDIFQFLYTFYKIYISSDGKIYSAIILAKYLYIILLLYYF